jgi:hypothetical protein
MLVGPGAGSITRGTVYALGAGAYQIQLQGPGHQEYVGGYGVGNIYADPAETLTGQWAWSTASYNITSAPGGSGANSATFVVSGKAIKVSE